MWSFGSMEHYSDMYRLFKWHITSADCSSIDSCKSWLSFTNNYISFHLAWGEGAGWTLNWANTECICGSGKYSSYDPFTMSNTWTDWSMEDCGECSSNSCSTCKEGYIYVYSTEDEEYEWTECIDSDFFVQDCSRCTDIDGEGGKALIILISIF